MNGVDLRETDAVRRWRMLKCLTGEGVIGRKKPQQGDGHPAAISVIELDIHLIFVDDVPRTYLIKKKNQRNSTN